MEEEGVHLRDPAPLLWQRHEQAPRFLRADTHWTPDGMQAVAAEIAQQIEQITGWTTPAQPRYVRKPEEVGHVGDIVAMLNCLPISGYSHKKWSPSNVSPRPIR